MKRIAADVVDRTRNVYRHTAKPEWGGAVIAWEREGKRGLQFEDGQLRVFGEGHYHLLEVVDVSTDRVTKLLTLVGRDESSNGRAAATGDAPSLDEQIELFHRQYPGGFAAAPWRERHRASPGRSLKRHREPAIELARAQLSADRIAGWLQDRSPAGLRALCDVLAATDLVPAAHVKQLGALMPNAAHVVLAALMELLHGEGNELVRLEQWIHALGRALARPPSWALATAPLALMRPQEHICVERASFAVQATSMAPQLRLDQTPNASQYVRALSMARRVGAVLEDRSSVPADLLDVHDFMVCTLAARAREEMAAQRPEVVVEQPVS